MQRALNCDSENCTCPSWVCHVIPSVSPFPIWATWGLFCPICKMELQNWMVFSGGVSSYINLGRQGDKAGLGLGCGAGEPQPWHVAGLHALPSRSPLPALGLGVGAGGLHRSPFLTHHQPALRLLGKTQAGEQACFCLFQKPHEAQGEQRCAVETAKVFL